MSTIDADPFGAATGIVKDVENIVENSIHDSQTFATSSRNQANAAITALSNVQFNLIGQAPTPPTINADVQISYTLDPVTATSFGSVQGPQGIDTLPTMDGVPEISTITIPDFVSSINSINIPTAPAFSDLGAVPVQPALSTDVVIPTSPTITEPTLDSLAVLNLPTYVFPDLPVFTATAPTFQGTQLSTVLQWTPPVYTERVLGDVVIAIERMFAGGTGLPPAIEQALFDRARGREDQLVRKAVSEASVEFSSRGFVNPPGMLASRVDQIRQEATMKSQAANRELSIQAAQWEIENLRFAVTQGIAAESLLVNIFLEIGRRIFEAAKFQIESDIQVYNAVASVFNIQQQGYRIAAEVFQIQVNAALSKLEGYKAQIQGELAKAQINQSIVAAFSAKVQALMSRVEIYKAQMQGAQIQTEIIKNQIQAYVANVEGYSARVNAEKTKFDAYKSQVEGEASKAGIIEAEAHAYAASIQGKVAGVEAMATKANVVISNNKLKIEGYAARVDAEKTKMQYQLDNVQANAQAFIASTQRFVADSEAQKAKAQLQLGVYESTTRNQIAFYQASVQAYIQSTEQIIRQAAVALDALKAAGQLAATLAAGAMASVHVGATLSGSGGISGTGSQSSAYTKSDSTSNNTNINLSGSA